MFALLSFILILARMLSYVIFAQVILWWLFQLNVVDPRNDFFSRLNQILTSILDPFYRPIRRYVPPLGNIDSAPLVLLFAIFMIQAFVRSLMF